MQGVFHYGKTEIPQEESNDVKATIPSQPMPSPLVSRRCSAPQKLSRLSPSSETKKTETRKPARKPEIVKTEPRANLVPINLEDEIRRLAYLFSERRGFEPGHETEDWLTAEREVRQRYHQQSA